MHNGYEKEKHGYSSNYAHERSLVRDAASFPLHRLHENDNAHSFCHILEGICMFTYERKRTWRNDQGGEEEMFPQAINPTVSKLPGCTSHGSCVVTNSSLAVHFFFSFYIHFPMSSAYERYYSEEHVK
ncbi:hypothetical protein POVCU1_032720 [Plasmodium ovale curtisi]|uniref:Uncharacterized protein n=1 Tax=Plasmodium ovale curtisi TaxID=864141 RepID=A0A1A8WU94_PLAOA|nr:hypothetical protein POVCU1_032720 [Plasmodium ovale curtisi]